MKFFFFNHFKTRDLRLERKGSRDDVRTPPWLHVVVGLTADHAVAWSRDVTCHAPVKTRAYRRGSEHGHRSPQTTWTRRTRPTDGVVQRSRKSNERRDDGARSVSPVTPKSRRRRLQPRPTNTDSSRSIDRIRSYIFDPRICDSRSPDAVADCGVYARSAVICFSKIHSYSVSWNPTGEWNSPFPFRNV